MNSGPGDIEYPSTGDIEFYNWKGACTLPSLSKDEKTEHLRYQEPA